jgi:ribosome modulation factor
MRQITRNPFIEGIAAYLQGLRPDVCPYSANEAGREAWVDGWFYALDLQAAGERSSDREQERAGGEASANPLD